MRNTGYMVILPGGLPRDVIGLSIGPACIYKQTLHIAKASFLVAQTLRFIDMVLMLP